MRWLVALALLSFAGCIDGADVQETCAALAMREPTAVPEQPALAGDPVALAHRFAAALGESITEGRNETPGVAAWTTPNGTVSQTFTGGRLKYMGYHTESAWTPWDGGDMEADLRDVLAGMGLDPDAYAWEGPVEGDFADSEAVYARHAGVRNAWWRVQLTHEDEPDDAAPWQQVMMSGRLDANEITEPLSDEDLRELAIGHARCELGTADQVRVTDLDATAFWFHGAPGKYVMLEVGECGGYYILDAVSGAVLEGGVGAVCDPDAGT